MLGVSKGLVAEKSAREVAMRRSSLILVLMAVLVLVVSAVPGGADEDPPIEPHPHMLLQKIEYDAEGEPVGVKGCVDLAANKPVPLHAHHEQLHFGDSGVSFGGAAGHGVIVAGWFPNPDFPLPWGNCEEFLEFFFGA